MAEQQPQQPQQTQGTEYTLQGVMRFLQLEWHNHERARNAWDIERAELKTKMAKQEGDTRRAKKINDTLDKQVRMLEKALRYERAKSKALAAGEQPPTEEEFHKQWVEKSAESTNGLSDIAGVPAKPRKRSKNGIARSSSSPSEDHEAFSAKANLFAQKSVEELTYILSSPFKTHMLQNSQHHMTDGLFVNQNDPRAFQEDTNNHQPKRAPQMMLPNLPPHPNHHPPPIRSGSDQITQPSPVHQAPAMVRSIANHQPMQRDIPVLPEDEASDLPGSGTADGPVERITHSYDQFGKPIPTSDEADELHAMINEDANTWDFDEGPADATQARLDPPRRPDTDLFPNANTNIKQSPRTSPAPHGRRRSSGSNRMARRRSSEIRDQALQRGEPPQFKVRFALRGHLDVVRSVIFSGGGSPSEPEICTTGDDGTIKRWIIPASYGNPNTAQAQPQSQAGPDLDVQSYFSHRGHEGAVTCLAACPAAPSFSTGGRVSGDGWIFSGGQDATVRCWERGRVDPKATLDGHTDTVWALCVLPATGASVFGQDPNSPFLSPERLILASGSADGTVKIWAVSTPPHVSSPQTTGGSRRGPGGVRRHSITSGSNFPTSPQPSVASETPFNYTLVHSIPWHTGGVASPTCITPLGANGESFVVSYNDSRVIIFDTRTGDEVVGMASSETYNGSPATGVNSVVVASSSAGSTGGPETVESEEEPHGATGSNKDGGVEGVIISGHEDRFVRFFDANSGQCTYSMLAHPASIASLSLSPDGRELVSAGHDASLRFWSLEKRSCVQELSSHRVMRGEGVPCVIWSADGRWVVSGGGDGVVKVFSR